ncbi:hypothetical protein CAPTEDRAFT_216586, partial [Capitella teleta]
MTVNCRAGLHTLQFDISLGTALQQLHGLPDWSEADPFHPEQNLENVDVECQYRGCYQDSNDRVLKSIAYTVDTNGVNSNGRCIRDCSDLGFTFAGTEAGNECYCDNRYDYDRHGSKPDQCSWKCRGNTDETCGGKWSIQIYSVCPTGKYKREGDPVINKEPNCKNECHCEDELSCFFTNGTCKDGCAIGWRGITCNER